MDRTLGVFGEKVPALLELQLGDPGVEIDPRLAPHEGEIVITKKFASCFFQTNLASLLVYEGDRHGDPHGLLDLWVRRGRPALDAVLARLPRRSCRRSASPTEARDPHWANLFDIDAKYGDVMRLDDVIARDRAAARRPSGDGPPAERAAAAGLSAPCDADQARK